MNAEAKIWTNKVQKTFETYSRKDRRAVMIRAAKPLIKAARSRVPKGTRKHQRGSGADRIVYNPGNLRRSIGRIPIRRLVDAIVGPRFAKKKVAEYGGVGQPTDGYYAHMLFGGAKQFKAVVMDPALASSKLEIISIVEKGTRKSIKRRARQNGISTR